jgi:hypothetical protein
MCDASAFEKMRYMEEKQAFFFKESLRTQK